MGIEQAAARMREIQAMTQGIAAGGVGATAASPTASSAQAAAFSQQLQAQMLMAGAAGAGDGTGAAAPGAANDQLMQLMQGAAGQGVQQPQVGMGGLPLISAEQLLAMQGGGSGALGVQSMLAGMQPSAASAAGGAPSLLKGDLDGLDPGLRRGLEQVARQLGKPVEVISGHRTYEEQAALYQKYLNGTGNLAAPPGHSNHESGNAADVYVNGVALANVEGGRAAAAAAGLHFPVPGEAWHVEAH